MGLYLVKSHVDALGGTCAVRTAPGAGTEFRITLPNQDLFTGPAGATGAAGPRSDKTPREILMSASCGAGQDAGA